MKHGLVIIGAGGHGRVVADAARLAGWRQIGFLDDREDVETDGHPRLGALADLGSLDAEWRSAIVALGDNQARLSLLATARKFGLETPAIVHPSAIVSSIVDMGDGVFVAAGAVVNVGASLGEAALINTGATVDHDCRIGAAVHLAPGVNLGGDVTVGERSFVGIGASVRNGVRIGRAVVVGAGAAVVDDIEDGVTAVGIPARAAHKERGRG